MKYILKESGCSIDCMVQSINDTITKDPTKYVWPVDEKTGNRPNGLTVICRKEQKQMDIHDG